VADDTPDLTNLAKRDAYLQLIAHVDAVLDGISDPVAGMATIVALVHHGFQHLWTGFYRVVGDGSLLRVGPYQGTLGCLEIAIGKGVCEDVHAFPGHITCDARSRSEIVVPVFDQSGALIAVFDIDSDQPARFDDDDRVGLERLVTWFETANARIAG
jgi:L-methionine (R)-S-oxide reductase